jgi:DNA-binding protein H-NS
MSDKQDQKKKDGENANKQRHEMHEHEHQIEAGRKSHAHNPATDVEQVTSSHSMHEHGLQNKEVNKEHRKEVDIHSDDKNERHTHVPKAEQMAHDLEAEEAKKA